MQSGRRETSWEKNEDAILLRGKGDYSHTLRYAHKVCFCLEETPVSGHLCHLPGLSTPWPCAPEAQLCTQGPQTPMDRQATIYDQRTRLLQNTHAASVQTLPASSAHRPPRALGDARHLTGWGHHPRTAVRGPRQLPSPLPPATLKPSGSLPKFSLLPFGRLLCLLRP